MCDFKVKYDERPEIPPQKKGIGKSEGRVCISIGADRLAWIDSEAQREGYRRSQYIQALIDWLRENRTRKSTA